MELYLNFVWVLVATASVCLWLQHGLRALVSRRLSVAGLFPFIVISFPSCCDHAKDGIKDSQGTNCREQGERTDFLLVASTFHCCGEQMFDALSSRGLPHLGPVPLRAVQWVPGL